MSATCNPTCFILGTKMKLRAFDAEKFSALLHVLIQTPTRRHTARFGGKTPKVDDPTGVDWNGTTINECERVGIADIRRFQAPDLHRQVRSFSFGSLWAASGQPPGNPYGFIPRFMSVLINIRDASRARSTSVEIRTHERGFSDA